MRRFLTFLNNEDYRVAPFCPKCLNRLYSLTLHLPHQILTVLIEDATGAIFRDLLSYGFSRASDVLPDSLQRDNAKFRLVGSLSPILHQNASVPFDRGILHSKAIPYGSSNFWFKRRNPGGPQTPEVRPPVQVCSVIFIKQVSLANQSDESINCVLVSL